MHKAIHPPRRPDLLTRARSERTVRIVPTSPALSTANLAAFNQSQESFSSIYSRSVSGDVYVESSMRELKVARESSRSYSSSSIGTAKKSPLSTMQLAESTEEVVIGTVAGKKLSIDSSSEPDIDDVATLQARLPSVKAVSAFGEVGNWLERDVDSVDVTQQKNRNKFRRSLLTSIAIKKTRGNRLGAHIHVANAVC